MYLQNIYKTIIISTLALATSISQAHNEQKLTSCLAEREQQSVIPLGVTCYIGITKGSNKASINDDYAAGTALFGVPRNQIDPSDPKPALTCEIKTMYNYQINVGSEELPSDDLYRVVIKTGPTPSQPQGETHIITNFSNDVGMTGLLSKEPPQPATTEIDVQYYNHAPTNCRLTKTPKLGDTISLTLDSNYQCSAKTLHPYIGSQFPDIIKPKCPDSRQCVIPIDNGELNIVTRNLKFGVVNLSSESLDTDDPSAKPHSFDPVSSGKELINLVISCDKKQDE